MSDRLRGAAAIVALGLALGGCSVAPPPAPDPSPLPAEWSSPTPAAASPADGTPLEGPWWDSFADSVLASLVDEALAVNRDLAAAAIRVEAAAAEARIAGADLAPQIAAVLDAARSKRNFVGFPIPGAGPVLSTTTTTWSGGLNISWEADLWGRLRAGEAAAAAGLAAAEADFQAALLSLAGQTAKAWFALVEAGRQAELARVTLENRRLTREQIERRYAAGLRGPLDLRLARASEGSATALVAARRRQTDAAARRLDLLLSRYPAAELATTSTELPRPPPPAPTGLPAELVGRRPDLRAAERRLAAAGFRVARARAALYPSLRLTGTAGSLSDEVEDLLDSDFSVWSLAGGLLQPLFQGGRLRAGVELGEARHREAAERYAQSLLVAFAEVETALTAERLLGEQLAALETAAAEAAAGQRLAEDRYRRGLGDYLAVLASQLQALDTASQSLTAHRALLDARVDLHLALGGSFGALAPTGATPTVLSESMP